MRRAAPLVVAVVVASLAAACATQQTVERVDLPTMKIVAGAPGVVQGETGGPDALEAYDARTLFARGLDLLQGEQWSDAAPYFERLLKEFPDDASSTPELRLLAHYNRGVAYVHLEDCSRALEAFDTYLAQLPPTAGKKDRLDGRFKRGQALAVCKRYDQVAAHFDEMLGEELAPEDRIEALVGAGVGHFMTGDRYTSEYRFLEARRLYKNASARQRLDSRYFVAQAAFYLAELARLEFSEYKVKPPTGDELANADGKSFEELLGAQLEEKCQRLLRAQYAYLRTIREEHPGWAAASGYNVGQMYEELHTELVTLPPPADLTPSQKALYDKMVRKKVLILLEKAIKVWQQTSDMATRTGWDDNEWVDRTRASLERVRGQLVQESKAVAEAEAAPGAS